MVPQGRQESRHQTPIPVSSHRNSFKYRRAVFLGLLHGLDRRLARLLLGEGGGGGALPLEELHQGDVQNLGQGVQQLQVRKPLALWVRFCSLRSWATKRPNWMLSKEIAPFIPCYHSASPEKWQPTKSRAAQLGLRGG